MERFSLKVAVYSLLIKDHKILLIRRFQTGWMDGNYSLPSGHLEKGETLKAGVIRETKEEVDIDIKEENLEFFHVMHRHAYIDFFFTVGKYEGVPKIMEKDKTDDLNWFDLDNLPANMVPSIKKAVESYKNKENFSEFFLEGEE